EARRRAGAERDVLVADPGAHDDGVFRRDHGVEARDDLGLAVLIEIAHRELRARDLHRGLVARVVAQLERAVLAAGPHGVGIAALADEARGGVRVVFPADAR